MNWEAELARADALVASAFDTKTCRAVAMTTPVRQANHDPVPDPARAPFEFQGTFDLDPEMNAVGGSNQPNASTRAPKHFARVCITALATDWPWSLKQNDRVEVDGSLYQLFAAPDRDGTGRVALWLNKVK